ncbi:DUF3060 domain-containing protein [Micromonospora coxensis]|uniref:Uncharacterized protein n=1 Tax=Micromonospora coxensis TaxID=356852 RepID=A0A1C5GSH0_9ACTN|nr:DUF3060 domain-containing protein [Micromonospora coxensis]SCG36742.1 Protein of unknown function [Micromonospora coxensis]
MTRPDERGEPTAHLSAGEPTAYLGAGPDDGTVHLGPADRTVSLGTGGPAVDPDATTAFPDVDRTVHLAAPHPTDETVHLGGTDETVHLHGTDRTVHLGGTDETVHLHGTDRTVHLGGTDETVHLHGTDETVHLGGTDRTVHLPGPATPAPGGGTWTAAGTTARTGAAYPEATAALTVPTAPGGRAGGVTATGRGVPPGGAGGEVRFGPGVPTTPPPAPAWPTAAPPTRRRPLWRRVVSVLSALLTVALVLVVGLWLWQRLDPLEITEVAVAVPSPAGDRCDVTVDVVATVRTNGRAGVIEYQWLRSGSPPGALLSERVGWGQKTVTLTLKWAFSGVGTTRETATVNIVDPSPHQARTEVTYACRGS